MRAQEHAVDALQPPTSSRKREAARVGWWTVVGSVDVDVEDGDQGGKP